MIARLISIGILIGIVCSSSAYADTAGTEQAFIEQQEMLKQQNIQHYQNDIAAIIQQSNSIESSAPTMSLRHLDSDIRIKNTSQLIIFVSSSMPESSLVQWMDQAKKIHATVVIRGLVGNSILTTKLWLKQLLDHSADKKGGIAIDPVAFENFHIEQVPAVVVAQDPNACRADPCATPTYDVIYGNTSLRYALERISEQETFVSDIARQYLNRFSDGAIE